MSFTAPRFGRAKMPFLVYRARSGADQNYQARLEHETGQHDIAMLGSTAGLATDCRRLTLWPGLREGDEIDHLHAMVAFVEINGACLAYAISDSDANKPLLITLHGGRGFGSHEGDHRAYLPLRDNYRILSFDYRGHGQSSRTRPYSFKQLVDDIEAVRKHFTGHFDHFVLCGGSFGGYLAQQYALTYPDKLSHLILRGTAPSYHHEVEAIQVLEGRVHKAPSLSVAQLKNKIFGSFQSDAEFQLVMHAAAPLYSETFDADAALAATLKTVYVAESHNELYSEREKYFDYRESLHLVTAKTLIIVGDQDWICPPSQSRILAALIPNAQLHVVAGANHSVHLEKNSEVIAIIRRWIDDA